MTDIRGTQGRHWVSKEGNSNRTKGYLKKAESDHYGLFAPWGYKEKTGHEQSAIKEEGRLRGIGLKELTS